MELVILDFLFSDLLSQIYNEIRKRENARKASFTHFLVIVEITQEYPNPKNP